MTETPENNNLPATETSSEPRPVFASRKGMWSRGTGDTSGFGGIERQLTMPGASRPPFDDASDRVYSRALQVVPELQNARVLFHNGELTIFVDREMLPQVSKAFRDDPQLRFEMCMSVSGVHYPHETDAELHVVYHLLSITHNTRVRLEVSAPESDPHVPSIVSIYPMTDWHERETWDMFGVIFDGHPHLTRILMPDDWAGHPQRKDYPLGGVDVEYKGARVPAPDNRRTYS